MSLGLRSLALASAGLAMLLLAGCNRPLHSSPTAQRDTNDYFKATSPQAPRAIDLQALDQITARIDGNTLIATMQSTTGDDSNDGFEHPVRRLKPGEKLTGTDASFEFIAFSVSGPGISKLEKTNSHGHFPLEFFSPAGKLLSEPELKSLGLRDWDLTDSLDRHGTINDAFPKLSLLFGSTQQPPGYYSPVGVFDARTKKSLVSGYSYSQIAKGSLGRTEVFPRAWHATPLEVLLDVQLDGKVIIETNVVEGLRVALPGGEVKLLGVWEGKSHSWGSRSGAAGTTSELRISLGASDREAESVALFATEPPKLAVHAEFLDEQGKVVDGGGGGTSGSFRLAGVRARVSEVKRVRFTTYTNHCRVALMLPPLPNLPAGNQNVADLFSVTAPEVQFEREYELRDFIGSLTQLRFAYPPGGDSIPTNQFPMSFTNVTPAQLLAEYRRHLTNGCTVIVDEAKQEIRVEPTLSEKVKRWIREKLQL